MGLSHLISIVGAGPGDPELLTVKALSRLKSADVVLYDALIGTAMLDLAHSYAKKVYVGKLYKDGQDQTQRQGEIHKQFICYATEGKKVVRLKAGDPFVFGRGTEEVRFCRENGLKCEVIPGITAALAGAANYGIPVTERNACSMALFYTGHRINGGFTDVDAVVQVLKRESPVMVYMGLNNLLYLSVELIKRGTDKTTAVQILSQVSQAGQKAYQTELGKIELFLIQNKPETPAVIIIGKHTNPVL